MRVAKRVLSKMGAGDSASSSRDEEAEETERLKRASEAGSFSRAGSLSVAQEEVVQQAGVTKKLNWHIMSRFCLLTVLNHMDRANLAYASIDLIADLGYSENVYGWGSSIFFAGYMAFQIPSQLVADRVGAARWLAVLLIVWGVVATMFAGLTRSPAHLYILRVLLGAAEAGTFPAMWAHMTHFYAGGAELAVAWSFIGAAQPLAQVIGSPIAYGLLLTDGFLGLRGWQWLFIVEGLPTIVLGVWIWLTLAPSPGEAKFLTAPEREHVARHVRLNKERMRKEAGEQDWRDGITSWKVYAQGIGSGSAGILRYTAMYYTPLIVYSVVNGRRGPSEADSVWTKAFATLLSGIPYSWAAISTVLNSWHAKKTGKMYLYCLGPLTCGTIGLLVLAFSLDSSPPRLLAFTGLVISATSQASNPIEWSYPATYLHGAALSTGWAVANCVSSFGGVVGPMLTGLIKTRFGTYVAPMLILAAINTCAVAYFAVLLPYLPAKREGAAPEAAARSSEDAEDSETLVPRGSDGEDQI